MIVAVRMKNKACIGGDAYSVMGRIGRNSVLNSVNLGRIIQVGQTYLGIEGHPALPMLIGEYFQKREKIPEFQNIQDIFREMHEMHNALSKEWFLHPKGAATSEDKSWRFEMLLVNQHGIFGVHWPGLVEKYIKFFAIGEGANFALGALEVLTNKAEEPVNIVKSAIGAASRLTTAVGCIGHFYTVELL